MQSEKEHFEKVYEKQKAVWTRTEPPQELVDLVETGKIKPCKVLDVGCGEGFYSIYLAKKGFKVTGIDFSENAIKHAKENAKKAEVKINFLVMDALNLDKLDEKFDFVLEWALLHQIMYIKRPKYVKEISKILNKRGKYLSVCFNIQSIQFGNAGERVRIVPKGSRGLIGMKIYFSSLNETRKLFLPYFKIIKGKVFSSIASEEMNNLNYLFMEKL